MCFLLTCHLLVPIIFSFDLVGREGVAVCKLNTTMSRVYDTFCFSLPPSTVIDLGMCTITINSNNMARSGNDQLRCEEKIKINTRPNTIFPHVKRAYGPLTSAGLR